MSETCHLSVETIGEAWNLNWQRCLDDGREGLKQKRGGASRTELDLEL